MIKTSSGTTRLLLSSVQRGLEAQLLHQYINQRYLTGPAVVLMGDFNKSLFNDEFKGLLSYSLNRDETSQHWLSHFRLRDSRSLPSITRRRLARTT
ncbi:hypothetical protein OH492_17060 [Vibrio chagasii]|nr:hypothetical protein [Vibrio chagasii]